MIIFIADTHFGRKLNSIEFWDMQKTFFYKQLIPYLEKQKRTFITLVHLGDVFDSRYSTNTLIAKEVQKLFTELASLVHRFYIIPGNHDYYTDKTDEYCAPSVLLSHIPNIKIIENNQIIEVLFETTTGYETKNVLCIPYLDTLQWDDVIRGYARVKYDCICTHTDLQTVDTSRIDVPIYSGHIHTETVEKNCYNLKSCFSFGFEDVEQDKGFYTLSFNKELRLNFIKNKSNVVYHYITDSMLETYAQNLTTSCPTIEDFLERYFFDFSRCKETDKFKVLIKQEHYEQASYRELIDRLNNLIVNLSVEVIPNSTLELLDNEQNADLVKDSELSLPDYVKSQIPNHLLGVFEQIETNAQ